MNSVNSSGSLALREGTANFEGDAFLKSLLNSKRINPELIPLKIMGELIYSYRLNIASLQREHEKLLNQKTSQDLVNIHMTYRMDEIQQCIKRSAAGLKALQIDFLGYHELLSKQKKADRKSSKNRRARFAHKKESLNK